MMGKNKEMSCIEIKDGIIDKKNFSDNLKILWVLKETNEPIESNDLCEFLREIADKGNDWESGWKNTYGLVVKVSYGLLRKVCSFEEIGDAEDKDRRGILKEVAVININKKAGGSTNRPSDLTKAYEKYKSRLAHQIKRIRPKVIIFGNTFQPFKEDPANRFVFLSEKGIVWLYKWKNNNNALCLWAYHPGVRIITHKEYYEAIKNQVQKSL